MLNSKWFEGTVTHYFMMTGMHRVEFDDGDVRDLVLSRVVWRAGERRDDRAAGKEQRLFLGIFDLSVFRLNWKSLRRLMNNAAACIIGYIIIIAGRWHLYAARHHIPD